MASAWGNSFGVAWGNSWGVVTEEEPSSSGVIRLWLIDYYTKEWAKKAEDKAPVTAAAPKALKGAKKVRSKRHSSAPAPIEPAFDVESLVARAEEAITRAAKLQRDVAAADIFIARLQAYAVKLPFMVVDFGPVLERYAQENALQRRRDEEDELLLLSAVL